SPPFMRNAKVTDHPGRPAAESAARYDRRSASRPAASARARESPALPLWERRRERLRRTLLEPPPDWLNSDELEAHLDGMPARYWELLSAADLRWHLRTIRTFLQSLAAADAAGTTPAVRWRHRPRQRLTEVLVCTWDRHGLLAKVAGAFALARINILRAYAYTRRDDVVLDLFAVGDPHGDPIRDEACLEKMALLLEASLSRPLSVAFVTNDSGASAADTLAGHSGSASEPPAIRFHNPGLSDFTLLEVHATDRLGLLHDILQALADCDLDISHASLNTVHGQAHDLFHLSERAGGGILDLRRQATIRDRLRERLGHRPDPA
ncbi:MAG: ACT domain-containing protein, partial [Verrucomicrobia bacterium]|nr:ACT domain-containing protein [Verrucomicrobiota bacterium]